jgi:hypothetical protein
VIILFLETFGELVKKEAAEDLKKGAQQGDRYNERCKKRDDGDAVFKERSQKLRTLCQRDRKPVCKSVGKDENQPERHAVKEKDKSPWDQDIFPQRMVFAEAADAFKGKGDALEKAFHQRSFSSAFILN